MKLDETSLLVGGVLGYLWSRPGANLAPLPPEDGVAVLVCEVLGLVIGVRMADVVVDEPTESMTAIMGGVGWYAGSALGRLFVASATYDRSFRRRRAAPSGADGSNNVGAGPAAPFAPAAAPNPRGGAIPPGPVVGLTPRT